MTLIESNGQAAIAFELRGSQDQEVRGQSASLWIEATQKGRGIPIVSRNFVLYKDWTAKPGPGNVVLNVGAKPIGTAARLGPSIGLRRAAEIAVPMGLMLAKPVSVAAVTPTATTATTATAAKTATMSRRTMTRPRANMNTQVHAAVRAAFRGESDSLEGSGRRGAHLLPAARHYSLKTARASHTPCPLCLEGVGVWVGGTHVSGCAGRLVRSA